MPAPRKIEEARSRGGVASFLLTHELTDLDFDVRNKAAHER